ncbi:ZIP family metal transporter [Halococcus qingdaonensis]|uniref:ZIP family metal transporter n=1 Tax=Halococcus qingdaonensis TaxID=224402 RepID=UPI0021166CEC|nr:metal transporter [Halococcus qingdaonensis]
MTDTPKSDGGVARRQKQPFGLPRWVMGVVPIVLLVLLVGGFVMTTPLAGLQTGEPLPDVGISQTSLPNDHTIRLQVTNNAPEPITISQVRIDEANWGFSISGSDNTLAPRESATIDIPYNWMEGYDYDVGLIAADGTTFPVTIEAAQLTTGLTGQVVGTLAFVGFLIGVVPIALGMLWFPFMQSMSEKWLNAVLAFSAGVLGFLVFDAGFDVFESAGDVPSVFSGPMIAVLGIAGSWLVLQAIMDWRNDGEESRLSIAYSAGLAIGLHNLAEGLAIGTAFATGRSALGVFLIIGFMIHNVSEGPVVVAPLADGKRPALRHFVALGLLAGAPAILGGWIGSLSQSPLLSTLFLAIGIGALLQVVVDIVDMVRRSGSIRSAPNMLGFAIGLVFMYGTSLIAG